MENLVVDLTMILYKINDTLEHLANSIEDISPDDPYVRGKVRLADQSIREVNKLIENFKLTD